MSDSEIVYDKNGRAVAFNGSDAVNVYRVHLLSASIRMYVSTGGRIIPTRGVGITKMLAIASGYTGKKYKRSAAIDAANDLDLWASTMKSALPTRTID